ASQPLHQGEVGSVLASFVLVHAGAGGGGVDAGHPAQPFLRDSKSQARLPEPACQDVLLLNGRLSVQGCLKIPRPASKVSRAGLRKKSPDPAQNLPMNLVQKAKLEFRVIHSVRFCNANDIIKIKRTKGNILLFPRLRKRNLSKQNARAQNRLCEQTPTTPALSHRRLMCDGVPPGFSGPAGMRFRACPDCTAL